MLPAGVVDRRGTGEEAARYIRRQIFDGRLRAGMRVPQDDLAAALGISRIPVREALIVLEREGWVTSELHRGAFVNALDEQAVRDHYDLYGVIYGFAAQRALRRGSDDLVPRLREIHHALTNADEPREFGRVTIAFHTTIVDAAASPRVKSVLRAMSTMVPGSFFALVTGAMDVERVGVGAIVAAFEAGDGERAAGEYARMLGELGGLVADAFQARGLFASAPEGSSA